MGKKVQIIKKILVKQVVTEKSKSKLKDQFESEKNQLAQECQQLLFEERKLQHKKGHSKKEIARRFQQEIQKRQDKMDVLDFKIEQLDTLEIGQEIVQREVEALVEVEVGTDWEALMDQQAIIIKDGICVRIDRTGD